MSAPIPAAHITSPTACSGFAREINDERVRLEAGREQRKATKEAEAGLELAAALGFKGDPEIRVIDGQTVVILERLIFGCLEFRHGAARSYATGRLLHYDEEDGTWSWSWKRIRRRDDLARALQWSAGVPNLDEVGVPDPLPAPRAERRQARAEADRGAHRRRAGADRGGARPERGSCVICDRTDSRGHWRASASAC